MPLDVSDAASNANEQIVHAANVLGRSKLRHQVFEAIYYGKKRIKTVREIADRTGLNRKQVLNEGRKLANSKVVEQVKHDGDTAYKKIDFHHHNKAKILSLAGDKTKLQSYPTKRNPKAQPHVVTIQLDTKHADTQQVTIDDLTSFSEVRKVTVADDLPEQVSEDQFKRGIQAILGERGNFKDWGGEKNDLFTTRVRLARGRRSTAFAFKGPGTKGKLVPGKMGKNGDQIQRLFEADAEVFLVQYCREIDQSVIDQMGQLALAKSIMTGRKIWYGLIDGQDSNRIYTAYREQFPH